MATPAGEDARAGVVAAYRAQLRAMTESDTGALQGLLADGFTLTHIGGYTQPKSEWLTQIRAGQFAYHSVEETTVTPDVEGDAARVVGHIVTDATVYGTRAVASAIGCGLRGPERRVDRGALGRHNLVIQRRRWTAAAHRAACGGGSCQYPERAALPHRRQARLSGISGVDTSAAH